MTVIQILQPDTSKKTYRDMTMAKQRDSKSECCFSNSIKPQTRTKQGEGDSQLSCHIQPDVKKAAIKFVSVLYGDSNCSSLNGIKIKKVKGKM